MENQAKNNPYYSRTDTAKLDIPNEEWKRSSLRIYMRFQEKRQLKELLPGNTMILMSWENIIVPFAEIIYSVRRLNFPAVVDGQVSLKQIKKAYIIKEILLMEWKE